MMDNDNTSPLERIPTEDIKNGIESVGYMLSMLDGGKYAVANAQYLSKEQLVDYLDSLVNIVDKVFTAAGMAAEVELMTREL